MPSITHLCPSLGSGVTVGHYFDSLSKAGGYSVGRREVQNMSFPQQLCDQAQGASADILELENIREQGVIGLSTQSVR